MLLNCAIKIGSAKTWLNWLHKRDGLDVKVANGKISFLFFTSW